MTKLTVDQEKCIGCGACVAIAPKNFDFNEEGYSTVIGEEITDETKEAEEACPVFAIDIEDAENEECDCDECHCDECECDDDECDCDEDEDDEEDIDEEDDDILEEDDN